MSKKTKDNPVQRLDVLDVENLAASLCSCESEETSDIQQAFYDKFDIDYELFEILMAELFQRLDFGISPLTDDAFIGFSNKTKNEWLVKKKVSKEFVNGIIYWLCKGKKGKDFGNGFKRIITLGGKPEYEITISLPRKDETPISA
jgi:hypothetical protein